MFRDRQEDAKPGVNWTAPSFHDDDPRLQSHIQRFDNPITSCGLRLAPLFTWRYHPGMGKFDLDSVPRLEKRMAEVDVLNSRFTRETVREDRSIGRLQAAEPCTLSNCVQRLFPPELGNQVPRRTQISMMDPMRGGFLECGLRVRQSGQILVPIFEPPRERRIHASIVLSKRPDSPFAVTMVESFSLFFWSLGTQKGGFPILVKHAAEVMPGTVLMLRAGCFSKGRSLCENEHACLAAQTS
ncbi:predicted protein [Uncinocarpus reesii 1704]|uniref:Uncharacterized protein n=1 Tax=Uncinocarpus reesii (strain UAMH 1704) TaxID=336963 RepID=C4JH98_UNCRE|nr:uncharacterized protein UREG_02671 [Uncinocarpus reesii 1704]EEP77822.1 predicted protein [Uncinocarpus reesii 1704]